MLSETPVRSSDDIRGSHPSLARTNAMDPNPGLQPQMGSAASFAGVGHAEWPKRHCLLVPSRKRNTFPRCPQGSEGGDAFRLLLAPK
jgi:hypothetical protein